VSHRKADSELMLPAEQHQYLEELYDAIEGQIRGATLLETFVVRIVKNWRPLA
jgi:hypothetical protein